MNLHTERIEVKTGQPEIISFSVKNNQSNPTLAIDVVLRAPQGLNLSGDQCTTAGQCTDSYRLGAGEHKSMKLTATAQQAGNFTIEADVDWSSPGGTSIRSSTSVKLEAVGPLEGEPNIYLHASKTEVSLGDPVILTFSATNSIAKPTMQVSLNLEIPSGWAVSGTGFTDACAGQCIADYTIDSGKSREITLNLFANQAGEEEVKAVMEWYFGDDQSTLSRKTETRRLIAVDRTSPSTPVQPGLTPTPTPTEGPGPLPRPDWQIFMVVVVGVVLVVAMVAVYLRRR